MLGTFAVRVVRIKARCSSSSMLVSWSRVVEQYGGAVLWSGIVEQYCGVVLWSSSVDQYALWGVIVEQRYGAVPL